MKYTILKENGRIEMIVKYGDGSGVKHDLIKSSKSGRTRYDQIDNLHGEYFLVNRSGDLEIYDAMGLITTHHRVP